MVLLRAERQRVRVHARTPSRLRVGPAGSRHPARSASAPAARPPPSGRGRRGSRCRADASATAAVVLVPVVTRSPRSRAPGLGPQLLCHRCWCKRVVPRRLGCRRTGPAPRQRGPAARRRHPGRGALRDRQVEQELLVGPVSGPARKPTWTRTRSTRPSVSSRRGESTASLAMSSELVLGGRRSRASTGPVTPPRAAADSRSGRCRRRSRRRCPPTGAARRTRGPAPRCAARTRRPAPRGGGHAG